MGEMGGGISPSPSRFMIGENSTFVSLSTSTGFFVLLLLVSGNSLERSTSLSNVVLIFEFSENRLSEVSMSKNTSILISLSFSGSLFFCSLVLRAIFPNPTSRFGLWDLVLPCIYRLVNRPYLSTQIPHNPCSQLIAKRTRLEQHLTEHQIKKNLNFKPAVHNHPHKQLFDIPIHQPKIKFSKLLHHIIENNRNKKRFTHLLLLSPSLTSNFRTFTHLAPGRRTIYVSFYLPPLAL
ncbi:hypothetical protein MARPO_0184s0001 [Marchantia polymorpha]|uniref:Uncharacterized protein n=1 Tax=Marchantia polymorpha TaxID=3197 RepID=A0A2R6W1N0_MARPO|nr:hypothetical protein MARPO_0184s0001 [Marchantia polymorpha]|eukprot:PTQ27758.1 hypothetical protein MARPO_0184s0001 [Marchantia polymorpha]